MSAMSSVCYNPFIYFGLNKHFGNEIKKLFSLIIYNRFNNRFAVIQVRKDLSSDYISISLNTKRDSVLNQNSLTLV